MQFRGVARLNGLASVPLCLCGSPIAFTKRDRSAIAVAAAPRVRLWRIHGQDARATKELVGTGADVGHDHRLAGVGGGGGGDGGVQALVDLGVLLLELGEGE